MRNAFFFFNMLHKLMNWLALEKNKFLKTAGKETFRERSWLITDFKIGSSITLPFLEAKTLTVFRNLGKIPLGKRKHYWITGYLHRLPTSFQTPPLQHSSPVPKEWLPSQLRQMIIFLAQSSLGLRQATAFRGKIL